MGRRAPAKKRHDFDPHAFLATIGEGRKVVSFPEKQTIFAQGEPTNAVFYIQTGKVRLTVVSESGKEATLGILSEGEFFGEGGLAGQPLRMGSATAMTDCELLQIDKKAMMLALHREHTFSDLFVAYLLARNIRYEEDLVDQLFNSSEKRLARILLLLAHFGKEGVPEPVIPKISQETLAEMIGTTRSRVSFFMNRFRKLGFVDYGVSGLQVHSSLLNVVLHVASAITPATAVGAAFVEAYFGNYVSGGRIDWFKITNRYSQMEGPEKLFEYQRHNEPTGLALLLTCVCRVGTCVIPILNSDFRSATSWGDC
jgi:CRP-like cAMP-binding protein